MPKKREDSSSDQNAASPTSTEQCNSIALPPPASAASADSISPSENTSSSNNDTCSSVAAMETDNVEGAMATCSSASSPSSDKAPIQSVYHVKWIKFKGNTVAIITQNENGPCPLLAIMNVLLLKEKIKLPGMIEMVTSGQLMEYLGDCIFENAPKVRHFSLQHNFISVITARKQSCGKVMFLEVFVCPQGGECHPWGVLSLAGGTILGVGVPSLAGDAVKGVL